MIKNSLLQRIPSRFTSGAISIILAALLIFPFHYGYIFIFHSPLMLPDIPESRLVSLLILRGTVISSLVFFIVHHLLLTTQKQESLLEIEHLKQAHLEARISSLKEQLSPHFLFNTLNTLSTLTEEKSAKDYVNELSNVYRYVLRYKEHNVSTIEEELNFITSYIYILKTRLEDAINISTEIDEAVMGTMIPPLTLQILLENAVKHNMATSYTPLEIKIFNKDDQLIVQNNIQPKFSVIPSTGTGLHNITQRYQLLFGKEISIEKGPTYFTVKLPLTNEGHYHRR